MSKLSCFFVLFLIFNSFIFSQQEEQEDKKKEALPEQKADSLKTGLAEEGVVFEEVTYEQLVINPLAPSKAAFYSTILPGLGQIYNKRYWKAPIVWGAIGLGVASYSANNTEYRRFRDAFKRRRAGFTDDEFFDLGEPDLNKTTADVSDEALQDAQEAAQRNRDLALLITIALYALNVIDANVDAHLKQYNVDDRLAMDIKPYINLNPINADPNYGLALVVKF
ncbi:DUF5683 domain-containing protein [Croceitalea rosinachiae]|uniref:DUF5683 domain-containing protein n=1 Tax=Croceitalea rosinachiae TaxID=3075596 RepID=A0ABU3ADN2_9FLAO|nr:DUF5683 domain-containing protein [Croceitalea sp. F388]MDT0607006.1 DUF5683 domain-containing protein [Croceitalea sp. F388]